MASPWQPQYQQPQAKEDKTKHEPSKALRFLIYERLCEERDLLLKLVNKIGPMLEAAAWGNECSQARSRQGLPPTPGDQQIPAQTVQQVTDTFPGWAGAAPAGRSSRYGGGYFGGGPLPGVGIGSGAFGGGGFPGTAFGDSVAGLGSPYGGLQNRRFRNTNSPWDMTAGPTQDSGKKRKAKDPIERYLQLEAEIDALLAWTGAESGVGKPAFMRMPTNPDAAAKIVRKARTEQLMKLLDVPEPDSDDEDDSEAESGGQQGQAPPMLLPGMPPGMPPGQSTFAPPQMQANTVPYPPPGSIAPDPNAGG